MALQLTLDPHAFVRVSNAPILELVEHCTFDHRLEAMVVHVQLQRHEVHHEVRVPSEVSPIQITTLVNDSIATPLVRICCRFQYSHRVWYSLLETFEPKSACSQCSSDRVVSYDELSVTSSRSR